MNLTTQDVPAAFISQADGQAMLEAADHHLTMAQGQVLPQSSIYEAKPASTYSYLWTLATSCPTCYR